MIKKLVISSFAIICFISNLYCQQVWNFSVIVGVNKIEADYYGGFGITSWIIANQFSQVNDHFNTPAVFNGTFNFSIDSIYEFQGNSQNEVAPPPQGFDYRVIIDGVSTNTYGGWYGYPTNTIMHNWNVNSWGGTFGSYGTDALTHEFGHSRGAIDLYALRVLADSNNVNGTAFYSDTSIMNTCYGISMWDAHSVNIINNNTDVVQTNVDYITSKFPETIGILVTDSSDNPLTGVLIKTYPVYWYTYSVDTIPVYSGYTNSLGKFIYSSNPFVPETTGYPWNIKYCNFLIQAIYNQDTIYEWMPLNIVQNSYFANSTEPYFLQMKFDNLYLIQNNVSTQNNISLQNYPNPFFKSTKIEFILPKNNNISLKIYNQLGQLIETLYSGYLKAGVHYIMWNSCNIGTGLYLLILSTDDKVIENKMIIYK